MYLDEFFSFQIFISLARLARSNIGDVNFQASVMDTLYPLFFLENESRWVQVNHNTNQINSRGTPTTNHPVQTVFKGTHSRRCMFCCNYRTFFRVLILVPQEL